MTTEVGCKELTEVANRYSTDPDEEGFRAFLEVLGRVIDECRVFVYMPVEEIAKASCGESFTMEAIPTDYGDLVVVGTSSDDGNRREDNGQLGMSMLLSNVVDRVLADERKPGIVLNPWHGIGLLMPRWMLERIFSE